MDSATATATAAGVAGVAATLTASRTASSASASPSASSVVDPDTDAHVILRSFEWSLVFNVCGFCVLLLVFSLLARGKSQWLRTAYQPRTFLLPERQRSPVIRASWNPFVWIVTVMRVSDEVVLQRIGPDAFSVIYIMRWMSYYFCFTFLAALTALVPTNITGGQALFGLDALTITNVSNTHRYWIIVVFSYVGTLAFLACLHRLFQRALCLRHTFLLSQEQRDRLSGYSLLVRDVPKSIRTPEHLRDLFEVVQPDSIHGIVISDYLRNLPELWDRRCATRNRLERVATEILQSISRARWAELCREQNAALTGWARLGAQLHLPAFVVRGGHAAAAYPEADARAADTAAAARGDAEGGGLAGRQDWKGHETLPSRRSGRSRHYIPHTLARAAPAVPSSISHVHLLQLTLDPPPRALAAAESAPQAAAEQQRGYNGELDGEGNAVADTAGVHAGDMTGIDASSPMLPHRPDRPASRPPSPSVVRSLSQRISRQPSASAAAAAVVARPSESDPPGRPMTASGMWSPKQLSQIRQLISAIALLNDEIGRVQEERLSEARALRSRPKRSWYLRWRKRSFNSVFVVFNNLVSPHIAVMANLHHTPGIMQERYIGVDPRDIYWQNLRLNVMERRMRWVLFLLASGVVIVFWSVLSTAINSVAQIQNLDQISSALKPLTSMDDSITGLIQGLIPSLAMSILTAILPICLRYLLVLAGHPTWLSVERSLIQIYYAFLIINVLLVGVIAGSTLSNLESWGLNPANILDTLAKSAPPVSTFFINYVLFQTCIMGGLELIRPFDILTHLGSFFWRNPSPRVTRDGMRPPRFAAGQALAKHSLIATIGLVYADIAPLILLFVAVYFSVWVVIYRYNFMYVYSFPTQSGGNFLFTASRQMFTGLYLHQIVLSGYFLLKKSYAPAGFLLFLIFITAMVQIYSGHSAALMMGVPAQAVIDQAHKRIRDAEHVAMQLAQTAQTAITDAPMDAIVPAHAVTANVMAVPSPGPAAGASSAIASHGIAPAPLSVSLMPPKSTTELAASSSGIEVASAYEDPREAIRNTVSIDGPRELLIETSLLRSVTPGGSPSRSRSHTTNACGTVGMVQRRPRASSTQRQNDIMMPGTAPVPSPSGRYSGYAAAHRAEASADAPDACIAVAVSPSVLPYLELPGHAHATTSFVRRGYPSAPSADANHVDADADADLPVTPGVMTPTSRLWVASDIARRPPVSASPVLVRPLATAPISALSAAPTADPLASAGGGTDIGLLRHGPDSAPASGRTDGSAGPLAGAASEASLNGVGREFITASRYALADSTLARHYRAGEGGNETREWRELFGHPCLRQGVLSLWLPLDAYGAVKDVIREVGTALDVQVGGAWIPPDGRSVQIESQALSEWQADSLNT